MSKISLFTVPTEMEMSELMEALREGRLYMQPEGVDADDTRAEVMNIVARTLAYAVAPTLITEVWEALLADENRVCKFRLTQKQNAGEINRYRIAAIVRYMLEIGLYDMQKCNSAIASSSESPNPVTKACGFRGLCKLLFPDVDAELYRRGCTNYAYYEDECLIRKFCSHE